jgi:ankyrin repeat protein
MNLHDLVMNRDVDGVRDALAADPSLATSHDWFIGTTPLIVAAHRGFLEIVELLLDTYGVPVDQREKASDTTALHWAAEGGRPEVAERLLGAGADPNVVDSWYGVGPLGWATFVDCGPPTRGDRTAVVDLLLARGAVKDPYTAVIRGWPDAWSPDGALGFVGEERTPLHVAAIHGKADAVDALLARGADPSRVDLVGATPRALDRSGRIPDDPADAGARLLRGDPTAAAAADPRLLHLAVQRDDLATLRALLAAGASPDVRVPALVQEVRSAVTPLFRCARGGRLEAAVALLDAGADPNFVAPVAGNTPLHVAAVGGHAEIARKLLAAGADRSVRDAFHRAAPAGWAAYAGHAGLAKEIGGEEV